MCTAGELLCCSPKREYLRGSEMTGRIAQTNVGGHRRIRDRLVGASAVPITAHSQERMDYGMCSSGPWDPNPASAL